jgi:DNA-binding CsgD family transcriptional regulator
MVIDDHEVAVEAAAVIREVADEIVTETMRRFSQEFPGSAANSLPEADYRSWVASEVESLAGIVEEGIADPTQHRRFFGDMVTQASPLTTQIVNFVESRIMLAEVVLACVWRRAASDPARVAQILDRIEREVLSVMRCNLSTFAEESLVPGTLQRTIDRSIRAAAVEETAPSAPALSARELEILELVAHGLRNGEIAEQLFLSENTVKHYITALLAKFDVTNRTSLVSRSLSAGIVRMNPPPSSTR